MAHVKPLSKALDLDTYSRERTVAFKLVGATAEAGVTTVVQVPLSIAYRLHHLGRAFDGQIVKLIRPDGMTRIDFLQLQRLRDELQLVADTTTDSVSQHYLSSLLPFLATSARYPGSALIVAANGEAQ